MRPGATSRRARSKSRRGCTGAAASTPIGVIRPQWFSSPVKPQPTKSRFERHVSNALLPSRTNGVSPPTNGRVIQVPSGKHGRATAATTNTRGVTSSRFGADGACVHVGRSRSAGRTHRTADRRLRIAPSRVHHPPLGVRCDAGERHPLERATRLALVRRSGCRRARRPGGRRSVRRNGPSRRSPVPTSRAIRGTGTPVVGGAVPYRDFDLEYPPGSLALFVPPATSLVARGSVDGASWSPLNTEARRYYRAFTSLVLLLLALILVLTAVTLRAMNRSVGATMLSLAVVACSPLLLGQVLIERFDVLPAAFTAAALAASVRGRYPGRRRDARPRRGGEDLPRSADPGAGDRRVPSARPRGGFVGGGHRRGRRGCRSPSLRGGLPCTTHGTRCMSSFVEGSRSRLWRAPFSC